MSLRRLSIVEQTALHLREGLRAGRWRGQLPGVIRLARELGIFTHTALILDETPIFMAAQQFLIGRNLNVPGHVSLVATESDATLRWCRPPVAHIRWEGGPIVRHVAQWANAISRHRADVRQMNFPAEFVAGGTIGPARKG